MKIIEIGITTIKIIINKHIKIKILEIRGRIITKVLTTDNRILY